MTTAIPQREPAQLLDSRVESIRRRGERLVVCYALSCFFTLVLCVAVALGLADYFVRFQDRGIRIISSLTLLVTLLAGYWRFLQPLTRGSLTKLQVARRIERRFPTLRDRLSSSIEFMESGQTDETLGSRDLQTVVIEQAAEEVKRLNLWDCLDARVPLRAALATLLLLAALGGLCFLDGPATLLAGRRMLLPWRNDEWPRWNTLSFSAPPQKIAVGDDFEVELIDLKGRLPEEVTIQYWSSGDPIERADTRLMKRVSNRMIDQYTNVRRSFKYRAFGGDDQTTWHLVESVEPPSVTDLLIQIEPPSYTRRPAEESGRNIRALAGSRIILRATLNKPLVQVSWEGDFAHPAFDSPPVLSADGTMFSIPAEADLLAEESGSFSFSWRDADGIERRDALQCQLRVIEDQPPKITLKSPLPGSYVTPHSLVPIDASVSDDLLVDSVELKFGENSISLEKEDLEGQRAGSRFTFDWELEELEGLAPGDVVEFSIVARDFRPQESRLGPIHVNVVSQSDLRRRLQRQRQQIQEQLAEALDAQRAVRSRVKSLEIQLDETRKVTPTSVDRLQAAEHNQRHVGELIAGEAASIDSQIARLLSDYRNNRVQDEITLRSLRSLQSKLRALRREPLARVEEMLATTLTKARGALERSAGENSADLGSHGLAGAIELQEDSIRRLEEMLAGQRRTGEVSRISRLAAELYRDQTRLRADTESMSSVGKAVRDLSDQERASLGQLAEEQRQLAYAFERLTSAMRRAADEPGNQQPQVQASLQDGIEVAQQGSATDLLHNAVLDLERNRIGNASQTQRLVERLLEELQSALSPGEGRGELNGSENPPLRDAVREILRTQRSVHEMTKQYESLRTPGEKDELTDLARQQQSLGEETAELSVGEGVYRVVIELTADDMKTAGKSLASGDTSELTRNAQLQAIRRLEMIGETLPDSGSRTPVTDPSAAGEPSMRGGQKLNVAQLKLVRQWQLDLQGRTAQLSKAMEEQPLLRWEEALSRLADEQERLAEVVERIQAKAK